MNTTARQTADFLKGAENLISTYFDEAHANKAYQDMFLEIDRAERRALDKGVPFEAQKVASSCAFVFASVTASVIHKHNPSIDYNFILVVVKAYYNALKETILNTWYK